MIRSMTGFCKTAYEQDGMTCHVEIKSVNHRFLDARIHLPKQYQQLEENLKKFIKEKISRGKIDVHLQLEVSEEKKDKLVLDPIIWRNIKELKKWIEGDLDEKIQFRLADVMGIKDLLVYQADESLKLDKIELLFGEAIRKGVLDLITMKEREGQILFDAFSTHLKAMKGLIAQLPGFLAESIENQKQKLQKNLEHIGSQFDANDPRIAQEVGLFIDRCDITEEIERFKSHLIQMEELFMSTEPVGRKLDFILQELNREANTICSKSAHITITQIGVELKSEIEKVREQVQNIE